MSNDVTEQTTEDETDALRAYERIVAHALAAADPVAALHAAADDPTCPPSLRAPLRNAAPDGVRMSRLLVARLRFERLIQGSARAAQWFEDDAPAFTAAFRRYHADVPPAGAFAQSEGRSFEAWLAHDEAAAVDG